MATDDQPLGASPPRIAAALAGRYLLCSAPLTWVAIFLFFGVEGDWGRLLVRDDLGWAAWTASYGLFLHETAFLHLPLALLLVIVAGPPTKFDRLWLGGGAAMCELPSWMWVHGTWPQWPGLTPFFLVLGALQGILLAWMARRQA